jgi:hypothetical protein
MNQVHALDLSSPSARLAQSRAQLLCLLGLEQTERSGTLARTPGAYPRSATMRFLGSARIRGVTGLLVLGLLSRSPARSLRWLRYLPATVVTRFLIRQFAGGRGRESGRRMS